MVPLSLHPPLRPVLVRAESAPKMLLHDEAMLEDVEAVAGELHIPV